MSYAADVYNAWRLYRSWPADKMGEFVQRYPDAWRIVKETQDNG